MEFSLDPDRSTLIIEARSSAGPILWEAVGLSGRFAAEVVDSAVVADPPPRGEMSLSVDRLSSGNSIYDQELRRYADSRSFPSTRVVLSDATLVTEGRYHARGELEFHGVTRQVHGTLEVTLRDDGSIVVVGDQTIDIRDFDVPAPDMLMLRVYPDVRVRMVILGTPVAQGP